MLDLRIRGRKALVCAASKGLGRACAMSQGRAGVELTITARTAETEHRHARDVGPESHAVEDTRLQARRSDPGRADGDDSIDLIG